LASLLAPLVAFLGILGVLAVLRTRRRVGTSLYEALREERRRQIEDARLWGGSLDESPPTTRPPSAGYRPPTSRGTVSAAAPTVDPAVPPVPTESRTHVLVANVSLAVALLVVLVGVFLAIAQAR
jgi:hypothetical protein